MNVRIKVATPIVKTARVLQTIGLFDVPPTEKSEQEWEVDLPLDEKPWNIGLIVGPSGSGKSTVARHFWPEQFHATYEWSHDKTLLDDFPKSMGIKEIVGLLSNVGFSSPPNWLRPYRVLSVGEQFRVSLARVLAEQPELAVVDEFTSVVDRTVAQIGSAALAKTVRQRGQRFVAVSCHEDIVDWLQPDWTYRPASNEFAWRSLQRRPAVKLEIVRCHHSEWALFRRHHYLDTSLNTSAVCFLAFWNERPVAFTATLSFPHAVLKNVRREHRTVCLPDFQGIGIGNAMSDYVGAICKGLGMQYQSQTSHPAMIASRARSPNWEFISKPNMGGQKFPKQVPGLDFKDWGAVAKRAPTRLRASFRYVGPGLPREEAKRIWGEKGYTAG